jgi:hypothetical protein
MIILNDMSLNAVRISNLKFLSDMLRESQIMIILNDMSLNAVRISNLKFLNDMS